MTMVWQEPGIAEKRQLFSGIVRDAEANERVLMLFSLMSRLLLGVNSHPSHEAMTSQGNRVIAAIAFLRDSLIDKPEDPFHGAFKRFYNHLHRQIIDAIRDHNPEGFRAAGRSIGILISEAHADVFIAHCLEQSQWKEHRLTFLLDRLFSVAPDAIPEPLAAAEKRVFIPLRTF